jgi:phosphoglycolate phosphatase
MTVEAIIFDKDGTLFDFQATWAAPFLAMLDELADGPLRMDAAEALGFDLQENRFRPDSLVIAGTNAEVSAHLAPVLGRGADEISETMRRIGGQATQVPVVDLVPVLTALASGRRLGLVTNDSESSARTHMREAGVLDLFAFLAGYDSGFGAKPEPGQLLGFAKATGIAVEATVMVGDSRHDLHAGRAAGMRTVGVLTGVAEEADLADLADVVLPDIGHLPGWVDGLNG